MALVRNQGRIVDNYQLRVEGMPDDWWSIYPDTVYLVPFGTGGTYEQEVEIHIHPPRSPEAEAKLWELQVVAHSKAQSRTADVRADGPRDPALHGDGHEDPARSARRAAARRTTTSRWRTRPTRRC